MSGFASPVRSILTRYLARSEKRYQLGPAAGSSAGIQLAITVRALGASGLLNAYRSVVSAEGSSAISGASRWLDAVLASGAGPLRTSTAAASATPQMASTKVRMGDSAPFDRGQRVFARPQGAVRT